jgi:hypothetical protein
MALQPGSFFDSDATGTEETIDLGPASPATSTNAKIASAFYGTDAQGTPQPAQVAGDGKSLSFTVLQGINPLVITLVSPNDKDETVRLSQGGTDLSFPVISKHSAVLTMFINGT